MRKGIKTVARMQKELVTMGKAKLGPEMVPKNAACVIKNSSFNVREEVPRKTKGV